MYVASGLCWRAHERPNQYLLRFAILASGSGGNAVVVSTSHTVVLVDCGLSVRAAVQRLGELRISPDDIDGLVVTHEHHDHIAGVAPFARRFNTPVHLTRGTQAANSIGPDNASSIETFSPHRPFRIGDLTVLPTPVPHDAREPCQFVFEHDGQRLGILTDAGFVTEHMVSHYAACSAMILEFNHDPDLLQQSRYPSRLKRRISSCLGHLSNAQAAALITGIDKSRLRHLVAAHVSKQTNTRDHVADVLTDLAASNGIDWVIAHQDQITPWHDMG